MGLYSLNRVAGLTENAYINKSLLESTEDFKETSLLEVSQIITEHENKMFNTLIELDFVSAIKEAEEAKEENKAADEAKKKNILQKAKELLEKVWNAIKNAILTFFDKVRVLLNSDKKIIEKYVPALEKLSDGDFVLFGDKEFEYYDDGANFAPTIDITMFDNVNKGNVEETVKKYEADCNKFKTAKLNKKMVENAILVIKGKALEDAKKKVKAINTNVAAKSEGAKDDAYEIAVAQAKAAKECTAIYIKTIKKILADDRKILILAGKWAISGKKAKQDAKRDEMEAKGAEAEKQADEEAMGEAFDFALCEASDVYVAECLEF